MLFNLILKDEIVEKNINKKTYQRKETKKWIWLKYDTGKPNENHSWKKKTIFQTKKICN